MRRSWVLVGCAVAPMAGGAEPTCEPGTPWERDDGHVVWQRAVGPAARVDAAAMPVDLLATGPAIRRGRCVVGPVEGRLREEEPLGSYVLVVCERASRDVVLGAIAWDRSTCDAPAFAVAGHDLVVDGVRWPVPLGPVAGTQRTLVGPADGVGGELVIDDVSAVSVAGTRVPVRTLHLRPGHGRLRTVDRSECVDEDQDGVCAPDDCDDHDGWTYPGAPDRADDDVDQDCDGVVAGDADGDGHSRSRDCDDADPERWEKVASFADTDGDGFGWARMPTHVCLGEPVVPAGDCNDGNPAVHPGAPERDNLGDDDCDGEVVGESGQDRPAYSVRDGDGFRYHPMLVGDPREVVGRLDDADGSRCWVFHEDYGSSSVGGRHDTWRLATVACAEGPEHLRLVAAVLVPGHLHENHRLGSRYGSLDVARIERGQLVVDRRRWVLRGGALVTERTEPGPGLELRPDEWGHPTLHNGGTVPLDVAGLVVRGPMACGGCWAGDPPEPVLHAVIPPGPDGPRLLAPGDSLGLVPEPEWWGDPAPWFGDGPLSVWAGDVRVAD